MGFDLAVFAERSERHARGFTVQHEKSAVGSLEHGQVVEVGLEARKPFSPIFVPVCGSATRPAGATIRLVSAFTKPYIGRMTRSSPPQDVGVEKARPQELGSLQDSAS